MINRILYSFTNIVLPSGVTDLIGAISSELNNTNIAQPYHQKIIRIAIEALQNQARHGKWSTCATSDDPSSFILYERDDSYIITTRNLICTLDIPYLEEKLQSINAATDTAITHRIRMQLKHNSHIHTTKGVGLGLMDMRRKSGTKLTFTFQECTPIHSFFQLTITLPRSDKH